MDDGISVREAEALAAACNNGGKPAERKPARTAEPRPLDPNVAAIEQELIGRLGTKVAIKGDASRGSITIEYFSMDDLDRVFGIIAGGGS